MLVGLFFFSGISALILEVVWLRMFSRALGCTSYATSTVLAAFMAGLALGSFIFGKLSDKDRCPHLLLFAGLQVLIAVSALLLPWLLGTFLPVYRLVFDATGGKHWVLVYVRAIFSFVCILLPTTCMGGTLPLLTVYLTRRVGGFGRNLSLLYAWNTFGAVIGTVASAFVLLDFQGETMTVRIAATLNLLVALGAYLLLRAGTSPEPHTPAPGPDSVPASSTPLSVEQTLPERLILAAVFVSGFTALAYEVIWSRQLILFLSTSVYSFACMLAVFLLGISLGSYVLSRSLDQLKRPVLMLGTLQLAIAFCSLASMCLFPLFGLITTKGLLDRPINLLWTFILLFPMAFCFGMTFPTATRCVVTEKRVGATLGRVYAMNTAGNILGALAAGFLLMPLVGGGSAILLLASANLGVGIWLLLRMSAPGRRRLRRLLPLLGVTVILLLACVGRNPFLALIEMRIRRWTEGDYEIYRNVEGVEGTVTAFQVHKNATHMGSFPKKRLWHNGVGMTFLGDETKLMAHLPLMVVEDPKTMLVICFGMGSTVRSAYTYPDLRITSVELVSEAYDCFPYYHPDAAEVLDSDRVEPVVGDGRNYVLMTREQYDVIVIDPPPPIHSAGTVNLYTQEFFELCKTRLSQQGVMSLWLPPGTAIEMIGICKTFVSVFPNTHVWSGPGGWGLYLVAFPPGVVYRPGMIDEGFEQHPHIVDDLAEYSGRRWTAADVHRLYMWDPETLASRCSHAVVITDDYPYTEFPLFNSRQAIIFEEQARIKQANSNQ